MWSQMIIREPKRCQNTPSCLTAFALTGVEVRDIGSFRSVRRFQTKSATLAWIVEQQARDPDESGKQFSGRGYTDWASVPPRRVTALPWLRAGKIMGCGQYTGMR
jgi:hypothetical protein